MPGKQGTALILPPHLGSSPSITLGLPAESLLSLHSALSAPITLQASSLL